MTKLEQLKQKRLEHESAWNAMMACKAGRGELAEKCGRIYAELEAIRESMVTDRHREAAKDIRNECINSYGDYDFDFTEAAKILAEYFPAE